MRPALCARLRPRLVGSLALYCGDRGVAEDLAQEALARAWARWRHVSALDVPERWVYRTAFNLARSRFRRLAVEQRVHRLVPVPSPLPDTATAVAVRAAVSALPARQRAAIVARYYLDLDVAASATPRLPAGDRESPDPPGHRLAPAGRPGRTGRGTDLWLSWATCCGRQWARWMRAGGRWATSPAERIVGAAGNG